MNDLTRINDTLPSLIDRAAAALTGARTSAEVLEARDMARVAYDAAKSAGRMARAKTAHDEVIAAVYRAQADAAVIEARAKVRLADEYDAAQERGEVAKVGNPSIVGDANDRATAADLGLRRDEIHDARKLRDAEAAQPGKIEAAAEVLVSRGEEPTKAALRREVMAGADEEQKAPAQEAAPDPHAKLRREFRALTPEGQEDDWIGLREEVADLRKRVKDQTSMIADLKKEVRDLAADEKNEVIRRLQAEVKNAGNAKWKALEDRDAYHRQAHALKKRVDELEKMGVAY